MPRVIVVDRLGQMDDGKATCAGGQVVLEQLHFVGCLERVVAADRDQRVDLERTEAFVDASQRCHQLGILQVCGGVDVFARVGAGGADHDSATAARIGQTIRG